MGNPGPRVSSGNSIHSVGVLGLMAQQSTLDPDAAPYWEGVALGELRYQVCLDCGKAIFYPRTVCPNCLSEKLEWRNSLGRGEVYAFTVVRRAPDANFAQRVPYVVALVALDEGFRMMTNVVGCSPDQVKVGMRVAVVFGQGVDGQPLPYFRPL